MGITHTAAPGDDDGRYIYTMTIRLKNGRIIRRANGRPFRININRRKKP